MKINLADILKMPLVGQHPREIYATLFVPSTTLGGRWSYIPVSCLRKRGTRRSSNCPTSLSHEVANLGLNRAQTLHTSVISFCLRINFVQGLQVFTFEKILFPYQCYV